MLPITVNWPRRMNYILGRQFETLRDDRFSRLDRCEVVAGGLKPVRARRSEYRAANAAAHLERRVRGVDDGVNAEFGYVISDYC